MTIALLEGHSVQQIVSLPTALRNALHDRAEQEHRKISEIVRLALLSYLLEPSGVERRE